MCPADRATKHTAAETDLSLDGGHTEVDACVSLLGELTDEQLYCCVVQRQF